MSDLTINVWCSNEATQSKHPAEKRKRRSNHFHKKMQYLASKGYLKSKQNQNCHIGNGRNAQNVHQNELHRKYPPHPTAKQNQTSPQAQSACTSKNQSPGSLQSNSQTSGSTHSLPSTSCTENTTGSQENPKKPSRPKSCDPLTSSPGAGPTSTGNPMKYLAIDCEMVGAGPKGRISKLARCSIVSYEGDVVYDKFINPDMPVTDYRTRWSGIRPRDLINAIPYSQARKEILQLLLGKVVIGHAIHNDFKALSYTHPSCLTRDTSKIPLLNLKAGFPEHQCASLKRLTKAIFNKDIQTGRGGHSSVEDAKATMELYKVVEVEWERTLLSRSMAS